MSKVRWLLHLMSKSVAGESCHTVVASPFARVSHVVALAPQTCN